ncbi:MAG: ankyrin repeat domain-containing protein [Chlamydiae bacterium]|nr:ankyrin repeat domain-containing protein [Chlamydiota bacterium]
MCVQRSQTDPREGFHLADIPAWIATSWNSMWQSRTVSTTPALPQVVVATTDIWTASRQGDAVAVQARIGEVGFFASKKVFVNAKNPEGQTPLFLAVRNNHVPVISVLLPHVDPSVVDRAGFSALHMAVEEERIEAAQTLLQAGFPVDTRGTCGYTPWQQAVRIENLAMLNLLQRNGADINATFSAPGVKNETILHMAIRNQEARWVKALVALHSIDFLVENGDGETALYKAVAMGYTEGVQAIIAGYRWADSIALVGGKNSLDKLMSLAKERGFTDIHKLLNDQMPKVIDSNRRAIAAAVASIQPTIWRERNYYDDD